MGLATNLLTKSPTTMPRITPVGFLRAVIAPKRIAACASDGMNPFARRSATWNRAPAAASLSSTGSRCSDVNPEGPGAAPLLAADVAHESVSVQLERVLGLWRERLLEGFAGNDGLRSGSVKALSVAILPGATLPLSDACLPAEISSSCSVVSRTSFVLLAKLPHMIAHSAASRCATHLLRQRQSGLQLLPGDETTLWHLLANFLCGTLSQVRIGDSASQPLVDTSIAQGRVLSPLLFDLLIDSWATTLRASVAGVRLVDSDPFWHVCQLHADVAASQADLQAALNAVHALGYSLAV